MSGSSSSTRLAAASRAALLALAATATLAASPAQAQSWPARPINLVVPFPPGGTTDVNARLIAQGLTQALGQTVIVENRAGASGNIGSAYVARAKPDGYTLVFSGVGSHAANVGLYANMPYDPLKDFTHITTVSSSPNAIAVHPDFPARSIGELLSLLKAKPGAYNYASPGNGSSGHLAFELLKQKAGLDAEHIPYKGAAPALADVMGGQVPILIMVADTLLPHVQSGRLKVLAVTGASRSTLFPDVPTVAESGFPGFSAVSWTGLSGPAGLPKDIVDRLHDEVVKVLNTPEVQTRYANSGNAAGGITPEAFSRFVASEIAQWTQVAKAAGLQAN